METINGYIVSYWKYENGTWTNVEEKFSETNMPAGVYKVVLPKTTDFDSVTIRGVNNVQETDT